MSEEDMNFIKKLVLASGSLKLLAQEYEVSYPTVRNRLNTIIMKISLLEKKEKEPFVVNVMRLVTKDVISYAAAKDIIELYEREQNNE